MQYNKINVYLRACNSAQNKPNNGRPPWYSQDKCFYNLLRTINWRLVNLTVVHDGDISNTLTEVLQDDYPYKVRNIDTKSYTGYSYEPNCGSSKSLCLVSQIIKENNIPENELIYILEQDYLHRLGWVETTLDFFNVVKNANRCMLSLYDHKDKYLFRLSDEEIKQHNLENHWGLYRELKSEIFLTNYSHFRTVPSICSSWIFTKEMFDFAYGLLSIGISDNSCCGEMLKRGCWFASPIPSYACHVQEPFLAPYINWEEISKKS